LKSGVDDITGFLAPPFCLFVGDTMRSNLYQIYILNI
jgi:hypothetical protein